MPQRQSFTGWDTGRATSGRRTDIGRSRLAIGSTSRQCVPRRRSSSESATSRLWGATHGAEPSGTFGRGQSCAAGPQSRSASRPTRSCGAWCDDSGRQPRTADTLRKPRAALASVRDRERPCHAESVSVAMALLSRGHRRTKTQHGESGREATARMMVGPTPKETYHGEIGREATAPVVAPQLGLINLPRGNR